VLNLWYDRRKSGRAASGGAVALEPPHTSRNTPKFIQNFSQNTLFFFHISDVSLHRESKSIPEREVRVDILLGVYFETTTGGEVKISGFYANKQTNKQTNPQSRQFLGS